MHQMRLFKVNVSLLTGNFERINRNWHGYCMFIKFCEVSPYA